jgi:hypothetical protein
MYFQFRTFQPNDTAKRSEQSAGRLPHVLDGGRPDFNDLTCRGPIARCIRWYAAPNASSRADVSGSPVKTVGLWSGVQLFALVGAFTKAPTTWKRLDDWARLTAVSAQNSRNRAVPSARGSGVAI